MAVTSIWNIRGRVDKVISYAVNPEKTTESDLQFRADFHAIDQVLEYTANEMKTERKMYVSGINCDPEYAAVQFSDTKLNWEKPGGNVAYHGYQAFKPGEVDAESAHQIGVKLAQELWGDRFEVVIATHLNTGHYRHYPECGVSAGFCGSQYHAQQLRTDCDAESKGTGQGEAGRTAEHFR